MVNIKYTIKLKFLFKYQQIAYYTTKNFSSCQLQIFYIRLSSIIIYLNIPYVKLEYAWLASMAFIM